MDSFLAAARNTFLNLAFPQRCHSCASSVNDDRLGVACSMCWEQTQLFEASEKLCPKCGAAAAAEAAALDCGNCADHYYESARSIGIYERALSANILNLKRVPVIPRLLRERMPQILDSAEFGDCDLIVPVPLSAKRRTDRGFNQAEYVAGHVAKILNTPLDAQSLSRKSHSPMHRASMDRKAREQSVKNAFEINRPRLVEGRSILLVDDIFTSGATASNCAKALKKNGAVSVRVFTLARTRLGRTV